MKTTANLILSALVALLLTACNMPINAPVIPPTATPLPTPTVPVAPTLPPAAAVTTADSCLVGTWTINDLGTYLLGALPPEVAANGITVKSIAGSLYYQFTADGKAIGVADNFVITADAKLSSDMPVEMQINVGGSTTSSYTADPAGGVLTLTDLSAGGLTASVKAAGIPIVSDVPLPSLFSMDAQATTASTSYQCTPTNLTFTFTTPETGVRQIILTRAQ